MNDFSKLDGFISDKEAEKLKELASQVISGSIVEIGSYLGKSTIALADGSIQGVRCDIYAIDPHLDYHGLLGGRYSRTARCAFLYNIYSSGLAEIIRPISLKSQEAFRAWHSDIGLLFIDGDHRKGAVQHDVLTWGQYLSEEAVLVLHDADGRAETPTLIYELFKTRRIKCSGFELFEGLGIIKNPLFGARETRYIEAL